MTKLIKKPVFIISFIIIVILIGGYAYLNRAKKPDYDFIVAKRGNLTQEVNVTGRVKPAQSVELAFEKSGKISRVYVKINDEVKTGQTLITLENLDLSAQLLQAQAGLEAEQAKLDEMKKGTRPEEIQLAETKVKNAEKSLEDAKVDLINIQNKATADLRSAYDAALTAASKAVNSGKTALITLTDIQFAHFTSYDVDSVNLAEAKAEAVENLLGAFNGGRFTAQTINELKGGAFGLIQKAILNPTNENIDLSLTSTISGLQKIINALNTVPFTINLSSTEKTNISNEKTNITTELNTVSSKQQAVLVQKATNDKNIATAQSAVNTAQNTLLSAQDDLSLKKAGYTAEQIAAQEAKVKSAQANVVNYQAQLSKTIISSPINGIVTKKEAKVGEIISANTPIVSIISEAKFEIETNISETDIAKVKIGDTAIVTLDAYGSETIFTAKVISLDPAETVIEGVTTYKVTLQLEMEDRRLKPGLTADLDILTDKRENVIVIPQRAITTKGNDKIAKILDGETIKEVKVETGLKGSDGNIEILEGIKEGDKVITFIKDR